MKKILLFVFAVFITGYSFSQCALAPVSLHDRVNNSSLIIEGKVVARKSFWNSRHDYIYTSNLVEVYKVFKGVTIQTQVEVITEGGEVDFFMQKVEPALQLQPNDMGIFTLYNVHLPPQFSNPVYMAYADAQGFIKYDMTSGSASDLFTTYQSITGDLLPLLERATGTRFRHIQGNTSFTQKTASVNSTAAVTGISPTVITAGTFSVLTISGSGFGATQGTSYVEFKNADDGGATFIQPHSSQYVSWSNTQIQVMVPTKASTLCGTAGTGQVRVTVAGSPTLSAQTLTVSYGHLNAAYSGSTFAPLQITNTRHVSLNGAGGITWQLYTGFDAVTAAKAAFLRALQAWRCATYINWIVGVTTSINTIAADGINVARFDIGSELPAGVLGRCTSYWSGCFTGTVVNYYVSELDICFDDATTWQYGPALATGSQYDFESVAVHELGHGHQLSHVINSADVMHYAIANAQNSRALNTDDINGGTAVMTRDLSGGICGKPVMSALNSTNCVLSAPTASFNLTSPVCTGQSVSLIDLSSATPTSWTWTATGGSPSTSTLQNTSTTYSAPGTYSITLIAANASGTSTPLTKTISVQATPTINVAGTFSVCAGASTQCTLTGAVSYTTIPGNLTGAIITLSPGSTTTYTILGSSGSCTSGTVITVTVTPTPALSVSSATICSGNTATLAATGASSYTWNPGGLAGSTQTFAPSSTAVYTVTGTNGLCTSTKTTNITVNPTPTLNVSGTSSVCSGSSATLTASGASGFTWTPGSLTGTSVVVSPTTTTTYTVNGASGSCSSSKTITVNVAPLPFIAATGATICAGNTATVFASGSASSYTWMPGSLTGNTQTVSPASTSVYTITGSNGSCTATATSTVIVVPNPTVTVSGPSSVCSGNSVGLTAIGASSFTWNPGGATGASQSYTPVSSTVYTVTGTNGNNCNDIKTFTLTVNPSPTLSVGSGTICQGSAASLTVTGASSYTWNPGGLTGSSQTFTPSSTTIYTVTGSNGSCTSGITTTIAVNPVPAVTVNNPGVCTGQSINIAASGGAGYSWSGPAGFSSTLQNPSIPNATMSNAGQYTVTAVSAQGCTATAVSTVVVNTTPTVMIAASATNICSGNSATLTATGAASYTFYPGGTTVNPAVVSPSTTATYTVIGSSSGCSSGSIINISVSPCTGIGPVNSVAVLSVYPNPTEGLMTIQFGETYSGKVLVYNLIGQELQSRDILSADYITIDLSAYAKGIYILKLKPGSGKEKTVRILRD